MFVFVQMGSSVSREGSHGRSAREPGEARTQRRHRDNHSLLVHQRSSRALPEDARIPGPYNTNNNQELPLLYNGHVDDDGLSLRERIPSPDLTDEGDEARLQRAIHASLQECTRQPIDLFSNGVGGATCHPQQPSAPSVEPIDGAVLGAEASPPIEDEEAILTRLQNEENEELEWYQRQTQEVIRQSAQDDLITRQRSSENRSVLTSENFDEAVRLSSRERAPRQRATVAKRRWSWNWWGNSSRSVASPRSRGILDPLDTSKCDFSCCKISLLVDSLS